VSRTATLSARTHLRRGIDLGEKPEDGHLLRPVLFAV
jgi:hypothetical protein